MSDQTETLNPRELRDTISALRAALEDADRRRQEEVQAAVAASAADIEQLKQTAAALRDALEEERERGQEMVSAARGSGPRAVEG